MPAPDVFLSLAGPDRVPARALRDALTREGLRVFLDEVSIGMFDSITGEIEDALRSSTVLLAYYSRHYSSRPACQQELTAAFLAGQREGDPMRRIVVVISGLVGIANQSVYAMTKGAIVQLTRELAIEYAARGVRVNAVAPGAVDTDFMAEARAQDPDPAASMALTLANHPIGRISAPAEIARAVAFLAAPDAGGITGTILGVDGGYTAR